MKKGISLIFFIIISSFLIILSSVNAKSDDTAPIIIEWNITIGGNSGDYAYDILQTSDGFMLAGATHSYGAGIEDMWLVKTDTNGNHLWNRTFGGSRADTALSLIQTSDGGFALGGINRSDGVDKSPNFSGFGDFWLVKTDVNGNHQWDRTYGGIYDDFASFLLQTTDGEYVLAGRTYSDLPEYNYKSDLWLVKTDVNGYQQWNRTLGGMYSDAANSLIQASDGGFALAGYTESYGAGKKDFWLVKTDANGNHLWNKTFGGENSDIAYALIQTSDGGFALVGGTQISYWNFSEINDILFVKTDANGNHQWNKTFGGENSDSAYSLLQTSDEGFLLAGYTESYGAGNRDAWLIKIDANGNHEWDITLGGISYDYASSLIQTSDGAFIMAGSTSSYGVGYGDFWLVKIIPQIPLTTSTNGYVFTFIIPGFIFVIVLRRRLKLKIKKD